MLGRGDGIAFRRVQHDDSFLRGCFDIDIVDADTGPADDFQVLGSGYYFLGHFGFAAHDQRVIVGNRGDQLLRGHFLDAVHREFFGKYIDAGLRHRVADQYFRHIVYPSKIFRF